MIRVLPIFAIFAIVLSVFFYTPLKRQIVYRLGISGDPTLACCEEKDILSSDGTFDESPNIAFFEGEAIDYPKTSLAQMAIPKQTDAESVILGAEDNRGKWIEVSLSQQKLRAWEGDKIVMEFPISSGLWSKTPKGDFNIWYKTRSQRMKGGSKELGTYYDLPNVPHNMFFNKGYGIHGAYWHNNFGRPMSHGCINAPLADAAAIFEWAGPNIPAGQNYVRATDDNPGTRVFVH